MIREQCVDKKSGIQVSLSVIYFCIVRRWLSIKQVLVLHKTSQRLDVISAPSLENPHVSDESHHVIHMEYRHLSKFQPKIIPSLEKPHVSDEPHGLSPLVQISAQNYSEFGKTTCF